MIIATRVLKLRQPHGDVEIPIRIFAPEEQSERAWKCRFEIDWPDDRKERAGWGVDAVQALIHALFMIGSNIYASRYHASGDLYVEQPGGGYGFPVIGSDRDLLVGDDAKFL